jgi:ribosomal protein L23
MKVWFPSMYMAMINSKKMKPPALSSATFQIPKSMTKTEVNEYLTKIYNLDVKSVNTVNMIGKWMTINMQASLTTDSRNRVKRYILIKTYNDEKNTHT